MFDFAALKQAGVTMPVVPKEVRDQSDTQFQWLHFGVIDNDLVFVEKAFPDYFTE